MEIPVLVLWGDSDRIVTPGYGQALAAAFPHAQFTVISQAGHLPQIEQPDATFGALDAFIRKNPAGRQPDAVHHPFLVSADQRVADDGGCRIAPRHRVPHRALLVAAGQPDPGELAVRAHHPGAVPGHGQARVLHAHPEVRLPDRAAVGQGDPGEYAPLGGEQRGAVAEDDGGRVHGAAGQGPARRAGGGFQRLGAGDRRREDRAGAERDHVVPAAVQPHPVQVTRDHPV